MFIIYFGYYYTQTICNTASSWATALEILFTVGNSVQSYTLFNLLSFLQDKKYAY